VPALGLRRQKREAPGERREARGDTTGPVYRLSRFFVFPYWDRQTQYEAPVITREPSRIAVLTGVGSSAAPYLIAVSA
jgi:hypothetical protein